MSDTGTPEDLSDQDPLEELNENQAALFARVTDRVRRFRFRTERDKLSQDEMVLLRDMEPERRGDYVQARALLAELSGETPERIGQRIVRLTEQEQAQIVLLDVQVRCKGEDVGDVQVWRQAALEQLEKDLQADPDREVVWTIAEGSDRVQKLR